MGYNEMSHKLLALLEVTSIKVGLFGYWIFCSKNSASIQSFIHGLTGNETVVCFSDCG